MHKMRKGGERFFRSNVPLIRESWPDESIIMSTVDPTTVNQNTIGKGTREIQAR